MKATMLIIILYIPQQICEYAAKEFVAGLQLSP